MSGRGLPPGAWMASLAVVALVGLAGSPYRVGSSPLHPSSASPLVGGSSSTVAFGVNVSTGTGFGIDFQFATQLGLSGGTIPPGGTADGWASWSIPPTATLGLKYLGTTTSVTIPPVGSLVNFPIPGLNLKYFGVPLGIYLNLSAEITANSTISGAGSGGGGLLNWSASGNRSFNVTASASAAPGSVVTSTLSNIRYSVSLRVDAAADIPLLGHYVVHLLPLGHLGLFPGFPSSEQSTYVVPAASTNGAHGLSGPTTAIVIGTIVGVAVATGVIGLLLWRRMARR
jgi:hypothetical protein